MFCIALGVGDFAVTGVHVRRDRPTGRPDIWDAWRPTERYRSGVTSYVPAEGRYQSMTYRRCGRTGLLLPVVSLGLWHNFGEDRSLDARTILRRAFDLGITHFDLANNYGPPYGSAETNFGRIPQATDLSRSSGGS